MQKIQRPILLPADYTDEARLSDEYAALYERGWHFACLRRDVPDLDSYRVARVGRREVIVQNVGSELRAFSNVCPHRFSAIRTQEHGREKLRCPYHLWSFDSAGVPSSIPHLRGLELEQADIDSLTLERWHVEVLGELVFVALDASQPLANTFGPPAVWLSALSTAFTREVDSFEQEIRANWKLIVQNTLELDHVYSVHADTFARISKPPLVIEELPAQRPHIAYRAELRRGGPLRSIERRLDEIFRRARPPRIEGYAHVLLFPATTVGTTDNHHVSVANYRPISTSSTLLTVRTFLLEIDDLSTEERSLRDAVVPGELDFTRKLFDEDRLACERVQRGVEQEARAMRGVLLPNEHLIHEFQRVYVEQMHSQTRNAPQSSRARRSAGE